MDCGRTLPFVLGAVVPAALLAQSAPPLLVNAQNGRIEVEIVLRADPPSSALQRPFTASSTGRSTPNGPTFTSRVLRDRADHVYLGYELLIEPRQPGEYLATFGKLGVTTLELAANSVPKFPQGSTDAETANDLEWSLLPLPAMPEP